MVAQQTVQQFAKMGEKQGPHARVEAVGFLAADGEQAIVAFVTQRNQRDRFDSLGLITEQVLQLFGFETAALRP